jgi:putative endonuclease
MKRWFVYIARCADGTLYTGMTNDLEERLAKHNAGKGAKYTRSRRPIRIVLTETYRLERQARKREAEIKGWNRARKKDLIHKKRK